jgi:Pentapeptide repeats (8 copies)
MSKRWDALPEGVRWLIGIAAVVLAVAVVWALFVPVADWLAHHDVGSVKGSLHETAVDNARGRLLTLGAGLFAAGALWFTARSFTLAREGQVTDRYTAAVTQLGSKRLDVRIGGIYALGRVAHDSKTDHPTVMEVLAAFIREHSRKPWPRDSLVPGRHTRPDVQAALTVIGNRKVGQDVWRHIFLTDAVLPRAQLFNTNLTNVRLAGANLTGANLKEANLTNVRLAGANLTGADLTKANLTGANLTGADLTKANLTGANLTGAFHDDGTEVNFTEADLSGADFADAKLPRANYAGANPNGTRWPGGARAPEGWKLDTVSGRLVAADPSSGLAEAN